MDERYWPKGASELIRRWLAEDYDPVAMPPLVVVRQEDGTFNVVGWKGGEGPLSMLCSVGTRRTRRSFARSDSVLASRATVERMTIDDALLSRTDRLGKTVAVNAVGSN